MHCSRVLQDRFTNTPTATKRENSILLDRFEYEVMQKRVKEERGSDTHWRG